MKMHGIVTICLTVVQSTMAGGTIALRNLPDDVGSTNGRFFDNNRVFLAGTNYLAQIYAGKGQEKLVAVGSPASFFSGMYAGYIFRSEEVDIPFINNGYPAWVQVRAWEVAGGSSFEAAARSAHWTGISSVIFVKQTGSHLGTPTGPASMAGLTYPGNPVIVDEPLGRKLRSRESADLSLVASGGIALSYQWYQGQSGDTNHAVVGATNAVYRTPSLTTNAIFWSSASTSVGSTNSMSATLSVFATNAVFLNLTIASGLPQLLIDSPSLGSIQIQSLDGLDPTGWTLLSTQVVNTSPFTFIDTNAPNETLRIYRTVSP